MTVFYRMLLALLSRRNTLQVLNYHQVLTVWDPLRPDEVTAAQFNLQMQWISQYFNPLPLSHALELQQQGKLPPRAVAITFDDGYENNVSVALPILTQWQVPATFFIASDFLDGGIMWNDRVIETVRRWPGKALAAQWLGVPVLPLSNDRERYEATLVLLRALKYLPFEERQAAVAKLCDVTELPAMMMSREQLQSLVDHQMEIGGHTCSHPILTQLSPERAAAEIDDNRRYLAGLLEQTPVGFAYPNGQPGKDFDRSTIALLQQSGYQYAVTTGHGVRGPQGDSYQIPRFTPWRKTRWGFLLQLAQNYLRQPVLLADPRLEDHNTA